MAGGTFLVQNKKRPGAYINFIGKQKPLMNISDRGIVTLPLPMTWGPEGEVIKVLSTDLVDGKSLAKIGYFGTDEESLIFRQALTESYLGLFYRVDAGGVKATATQGNLISTAKYTGTTGNKLKVVIKENVLDDTKFDVVTLFDNAEKDIQTVADCTQLVSNDFIDFSSDSNHTLALDAGKALTGGTNGTIASANYTGYFNKIKKFNFNAMGIPSADTTLPPLAKAFIKDLRDNQGIKAQCVVNSYLADYEGIISVDQGYKTPDETVSVIDFVARVAGMTAGAAVNVSNTYRVIENAIEIINEYDNETIKANIDRGMFMLSKRIDDVIVVETDINTLVTLTPDKNYAFRKNRVIRCLDEIGNTVSLVFQKSYIGKVDNDLTGRNMFKTDLIQYFLKLQRIKAIQLFNSKTDIEVLPGETIDSVVVNTLVQPTDAMEKLYMTVLVA